LENYDMALARLLTRGCDVWLNNPVRPLEASGTSGMKVPVNGGINVSVLDGWWGEGYRGDNGWAIGSGEETDDHAHQDEVESLALYDLLETEIAPAFYRRGSDGLPQNWIATMKASMRTLIPVFNTHRMAEDYCERFYLPASLQLAVLTANSMADARRLASWKQRVAAHWPEVQVVGIESETPRGLKVGDVMPVAVRVRLGMIAPEEVTVEAVTGPLNARGELVDGAPQRLEHAEQVGQSGEHIFRGGVTCTASGRYGFSVRVLPFSRGLSANPFEMGLIRWWGDPVSAQVVAASV
jgi:starch phosphorylase